MIAIKILIAVGAFLMMEGVAWFTHKYIMHGFLWSWHKDHHVGHSGFFERNDLFAIFFSLLAFSLFFTGFMYDALWFNTFIGIGVTGYGLSYFIFHDIIVHRRYKHKWKFGSNYMKKIIRVHKIHHKHINKEGAQAFGFLYAHKKFNEYLK